MTNFNCPHCGQPISISKGHQVKSRQPNRRTFTLFQSSHQSPFKNVATALPPSPGYEAYTESPSFLPNRESHVTVPLLRSLITGGFFGFATGVGVTYLSLLGNGGFWFSIESGAMTGMVVFFGSSFFYWLHITGKYDGLLSRVETITGLDIDQDGEVGEPQATPIRVEVEEGTTWKYATLPGDPAALIGFAKSIIGGAVTFSEAGAKQSGYPPADFARLRDIFLERNWAQWNHPTNRQQGVSLYRAGRTILGHIAQESPPEKVNDRLDDDRVGMSPNYVIKGTKRGSWS